MINPTTALTHLLHLLSTDGPSGQETPVVNAITKILIDAGCPPDWIKTDDAHTQLGQGFEIGNLIITLPGTIPSAPRILFSAHMDTVPLCKDAEPVIEGNRIVAQGNTGLGGDDRAGCAAIVAMAETLLKNNLPHPPITLLFPIAEENGLHGSGKVSFDSLSNPVMGFNLDGQDPNEIVIGAMSAMRWKAKITGRSAHAGLAPHKGISAALIASKAIARIAEEGYFGRIEKGGNKGTSNIGTIHGGEANNQVMDQMVLTGECRSHNHAFLEKIVSAYKASFEWAAQSVTNDAGECGQTSFVSTSDYRAFRLNKAEDCVKISSEAVRKAGLSPNPLIMDAGLDANNFNEKGLPTVTLGTGTHHFHQTDEYIEIDEYLTTCNVLLNIVGLAGGA